MTGNNGNGTRKIQLYMEPWDNIGFPRNDYSVAFPLTKGGDGKLPSSVYFDPVSETLSLDFQPGMTEVKITSPKEGVETDMAVVSMNGGNIKAEYY